MPRKTQVNAQLSVSGHLPLGRVVFFAMAASHPLIVSSTATIGMPKVFMCARWSIRSTRRVRRSLEWHPQNTDVVAVSSRIMGLPRTISRLAGRSASWAASISASIIRVNSLSSEIPTTLRQSLVGAMTCVRFSFRRRSTSSRRQARLFQGQFRHGGPPGFQWTYSTRANNISPRWIRPTAARILTNSQGSVSPAHPCPFFITGERSRGRAAAAGSHSHPVSSRQWL